MSFQFNPGQAEADPICLGPATHVMLEGGRSSGKTVLHLRNIVARAIKAPGSRHLVARFRFNHCKQSIAMETMPFVLEKCFPSINASVKLDKSDWYYKFPNRSEIWLGGLDEKDRTEKILGKRYATVYPNECSQIPWSSVMMLQSCLAQLVMEDVEGDEPKPLKLRMLYDCNPPSKGHWTYKIFHLKQDPDTKQPLPDGEQYAYCRINPEQNEMNLAPGALDILRNQPSRFRKRFFEGEYAEDNPNALFSDIVFDKWRSMDGSVPEFTRVVVGVDPSGASDDPNDNSDAIGIVVVGLGTDGNAYVLEDCTLHAGPATWGRVTGSAFDRHAANIVVGEKNYGGEMVKFTIQTARPNTPYRHVPASKGKTVRADPVAALYETGKVRHVGIFRELEDELLSFSSRGYLGQKSPNRADALIWCIYELFPALTQGEEKPLVLDPQYSKRLEFV